MKNRIFLILIFLSCFKFVSATFVLSGTTITQSGTDANLDGLTAITGVTTQTITGIYPLKIFTLTDRKLKVTGTLNIGSREKIIFTSQGASGGILDVSSGGILTIGEIYTKNGFDVRLPSETIVFALTSPGSWNTGVWIVGGTGIMRAYNSVFRIPHGITFQPSSTGEILIEDCIIDKRGSIGDIQTNLSNDGTRITIRNSRIYADGQSGITFRSTASPLIENVSVYQARDAWNNESGSQKIIRGLVPETGTNADAAQYGNNTITVVNARKGIQFTWGGHLENNGGNTGQVSAWQELNSNFRLSNGTGIAGAVFYLTDTPVAADTSQTSLANPLGGTVNTAVKQVYYGTTDANGNVPMQTILIGSGLRTTGGLQIAGGNNNRIRPRGKNTTAIFDAVDDAYDYTVWSYLHESQTNPIVLKAGNSGTAIFEQAILSPDQNVTLSKTAAAALTGIAINHAAKTITVSQPKTLCDLYDFAKNNKLALANIEFPTISTLCAISVGRNLEIGGYQLVLTATAVLKPCNKYEKIISTKVSNLNDPNVNLEVALTDPNGTYKLINLQNIIAANVTIKDVNTNTILKQLTNYTGELNLTTLSTSNNVSILVEKAGFGNWGTVVDLTAGEVFSFVVVQTVGTVPSATLGNQQTELYLTKKLLKKEDEIKSTLNSLPNSTLNETIITQPAAIKATKEKQQELVDFLKKILRLHSNNREKLK